MSTIRPHVKRRKTPVLVVVAIGVAIALYFDFAGAPLEEAEQPASFALDAAPATAEVVSSSSEVIPAAGYAEMRRTELSSASRPKPSLERIHPDAEFQRCITCHDPHSMHVRPNEFDKLQSLAIRAERRAFNGAPPIIPHAVDGTNDAACYACHGEGALIGQRVANRMSHGRLANCLQCHAAPPPSPFKDHGTSVSNAFAGLPAPTSGSRAFHGAPPEIPHSTWMREHCLSCHGGVVGWAGLEVTHRWRTNCLQCHATSATLEQSAVASLRQAPPASPWLSSL